ncbi:TonB-dependent receptor [Sphingobium sp. 3R8]|uniref:TonB-dependent receptor n=1 Tax=Sphingobium sp. 3R8 TaxID=2874921 RepID=UPI001CCB62E0|nr:TonB-dependent receptor [Sphingobium sp. 3R8]MBZ9646896.1 TonB-dependent receptor [Sphingobium sp. 3R8]
MKPSRMFYVAALLGGTILSSEVNAQTDQIHSPKIPPEAGLPRPVARGATAHSDAGAATPSPAESATSRSEGEIVVTARKRNESVQEVPISIAVASGETLRRVGISSIEGLTAITSGLTMRRSANQVTVPTLRGLGTGTSSETFEQSIAEFLDGTYIGRAPEYEGGIFDLQRVEILKGTQAALLAKNTSLGAISYVTRKPGNDFEYNLSGGYELALESYNFEGGATIPLTQNLSVRVSGMARHQGGWVRNDITGNDDPRTNAWAGRIIAQLKPTDDLSVTLLYQHFNTRTKGNAVEFVADVLGNGQRFALLAGNPNFEANLDGHSSPTNGAFGEHAKTTGDRLIGTLTYDIGGSTLTSVSSYSRFDQDVTGDKDFNTGLYANQITYLGNKLFSQELRFASPAGQPLNYILGVYYQNEEFQYRRFSQTQVIVPNGTFSDGLTISTDTYSAFGSANYEITNGLSANLGVRVTHEPRRGAYTDRIYSVPGSIVALFPAFPAATRRISETNVDGSVGLQYKTSGGSLYYASASRGTKSGTFLSAPSTPATAVIPSERATTYEAGAKWTLDQGIFNLSVFHTTIDNLQQANFNGSIFITDPRKVRSYGAELEASYRLTDSLRSTASITYAHARQVADAAHPDDNSRVVNAPLWSGSVGLAYDQPVGNDFRLTANGDVEFRSEVIFVPEASSAGYGTNPRVAVVPPGKANAKLNARIGFGPLSDKWEVAVLGRNLNNRRVLGYAIPATFQAGAAVGSSDLPRTVMIQFSVKY